MIRQFFLWLSAGQHECAPEYFVVWILATVNTVLLVFNSTVAIWYANRYVKYWHKFRVNYIYGKFLNDERRSEQGSEN